MPAGQPTKYSPDVVAPLLEAIANGASVNRTLEAAGIYWSTWCNWKDANPEFLEKYTRAMESRVDVLWNQVVDIADEEAALNPQAAKLKMDARVIAAERMQPRKYGKRETRELVGDPTRPIAVNVQNLTDDELRAAIEIAGKLSPGQ